MIIIYKKISHNIYQIFSGHNCLVIPVSPQFPDVIKSIKEMAMNSDEVLSVTSVLKNYLDCDVEDTGLNMLYSAVNQLWFYATMSIQHCSGLFSSLRVC